MVADREGGSDDVGDAVDETDSESDALSVSGTASPQISDSTESGPEQTVWAPEFSIDIGRLFMTPQEKEHLALAAVLPVLTAKPKPVKRELFTRNCRLFIWPPSAAHGPHDEPAVQLAFTLRSSSVARSTSDSRTNVVVPDSTVKVSTIWSSEPERPVLIQTSIAFWPPVSTKLDFVMLRVPL
jgi:P pilus assembly chaperone PapD